MVPAPVPRASPLVLEATLPVPDVPRGVTARCDDRFPHGGAAAVVPALRRVPELAAAPAPPVVVVAGARRVVVVAEPEESLEPVEELGSSSLRTAEPWLFPGV